jgi:hypothetical protein
MGMKLGSDYMGGTAQMWAVAPKEKKYLHSHITLHDSA